MMTHDREWLEADGLGGFASGTLRGIRTRRYHALLLAAATPPTGRVVLVNGLDAWIATATGDRYPLSSHRYLPDVEHPAGDRFIKSFTSDPWPTWSFELPDGTRVEQEILVEHAGPTLVRWRRSGTGPAVRLEVRLLLSGRDYHALHHQNDAVRLQPAHDGNRLVWHPYDGVPAIHVMSNAAYTHAPDWYRQFVYSEERARGLDDTEDLASPGVLTFELAEGEAVLMLAAGEGASRLPAGDVVGAAAAIRQRERDRRAQFETPLARAAAQYLVRRGDGLSIVAGYPWFTDWGRDTFIAVRGLCLAQRHLADARDVLLAWADSVSRGMLPNRFADAGEEPEFNAVDASLWFVVAVHELLAADRGRVRVVAARDRARLQEAIVAIVAGYAAGTRYGIRGDADGLLAAGEAGVQLTWMDARVGSRVITPRIGKPVEVQALWVNALWIAAQIDSRWAAVLAQAVRSFGERFWNRERGHLNDVVDVDHVRGTADPTLRPNQILAVGGLPFRLVDGDRARAIVDVVERSLVTPVGLRSLASSEPGYTPRYGGGPETRDAAYHQGTVWPWLIGPFVDAWLAVRGDTREARLEARARFVTPLLSEAERFGSGHVFEVADAEPPHTPGGCPFQAWSLGELIRADRATAPSKSRRRQPALATT